MSGYYVDTEGRPVCNDCGTAPCSCALRADQYRAQAAHEADVRATLSRLTAHYAELQRMWPGYFAADWLECEFEHGAGI